MTPDQGRRGQTIGAPSPAYVPKTLTSLSCRSRGRSLFLCDGLVCRRFHVAAVYCCGQASGLWPFIAHVGNAKIASEVDELVGNLRGKRMRGIDDSFRVRPLQFAAAGLHADLSRANDELGKILRHKLLAVFGSDGNDHIMPAARKFRGQRVAIASPRKNPHGRARGDGCRFLFARNFPRIVAARRIDKLAFAPREPVAHDDRGHMSN